ncbi:hypothetical protein Tco_0724907 [Tanacetum coccineum]|uniref:Uncharacterized protein n=1 Tax=Tanacetum coccineum TaxID=301880 RepID=A0ABQ4YC84_9ASTR
MDDEFTSMAYPKVQENLKLPTEGDERLEEPASSAGTLSSMKNLNKEFSFTDQFLDTSSVPLMTTLVIDITDPQSDSTTVPASMPTTTTTVTETITTTIVPPPPPQPQQDNKADERQRRKDSPPPPPSSTTNQGDQSHSSATPGSSKTAASTTYTAWTMTTSRFKSAASFIPEDVLMHEEPATPEPVWSIPSSSIPVPNHNWASAIASSFVSPPENSLLSQTGDIGVFIDWLCKMQGITKLTPEHLEMEECHKLLTNQVDEGLLRYNVSRPLPLGGPPGQVTIQTEFFFNKDLEYLRFGHKGNRLALSITKIKVASYPDAGLEQMVPDQTWAKEEYMYNISASYGISHWWFKRQQFYIERHSADTNRRAIYDYMKKIVLRKADNQEYTIAESDFKDLYPSDFEDLYLLNLQGHCTPQSLRSARRHCVRAAHSHLADHIANYATLFRIELVRELCEQCSSGYVDLLGHVLLLSSTVVAASVAWTMEWREVRHTDKFLTWRLHVT